MTTQQRKMLFIHLFETQLTYRGGMSMIWGRHNTSSNEVKNQSKEYLRDRITEKLIKLSTKLNIKYSHKFEYGKQLLLWDLEDGDIDIILEISKSYDVYKTTPLRFDDNGLKGCMGVEEYYKRITDTNDDEENKKQITYSVNRNKKWVNTNVSSPNDYVILTDWWSNK